MEIDSQGSREMDSGRGGNMNDGFEGDNSQRRGSMFQDGRRCHSDTSLHEHTDDNYSYGENPSDLVGELRVRPTNVPKRTRHVSQPGPPRVDFDLRGQQNRIRPSRSPLVSMDGLVYDPITKKFMKRSVAENQFERNNYKDTGSPSRLTPNQSFIDSKPRNPQITRLQRNFSDSNGFANPPDIINNRLAPRNNIETRSVSAGSFHRSIAPSYREIGSLASMEHHSMPPSTEKEKSRAFRSMLSSVMSAMYAVLIVTIGLIIFVYDVFTKTPVAEYYCIYLVIIGFGYLGYLLIDLRLYIHKAKQHYKKKRLHDEAYDQMMKLTEVENLDGPLTILPGTDPNGNVNIEVDLPPPVAPLEHPYCFAQGRHAGSFYLKLGAAGFCLGHLVHAALLLSLQVAFLQHESDCGNIVVLVLEIIYPIYSFCQLFFIFKYSNVIILKNKGPGRLALMHCIASSLCFWIWTIIRETMDAIVISSEKKSGDGKMLTFNNMSHLNEYVNSLEPDVINLRSAYSLPSQDRNNCSALVGFTAIFSTLSPYLYPFTVEYSILIVGIFFIIWSNIGNCPKEDSEKGDYHDRSEWASDESTQDADCKMPTAIDDNGLTSNIVIHIDCHSANKGVFGGMIIVVFTIVSVIMCFVLFSESTKYERGVELLRVTNVVLHMVMLIAVGFAYNQIKKLDVNPHPISLLDDILLFICVPAFVMDLTLTLIATIEYEDFFLLGKTFLMALQAIIQIPFIADALRRCSNSKQLQRNKPGRELITFLIICNVATWLFETFSIKNAEVDDVRYEYYGKLLWGILGHITTPLTMFYRFHSSVCLVDIWKGAYEPGNAH